jgi:acetyl esterase
MTTITVSDGFIQAQEHRIPIRRYLPASQSRDAAPAPTLVWLHGGGFFRGSMDQPEADAVARALASRGLSVVTVAYRLAPFPLVGRVNPSARPPRVRYPLPADDVLAVVRHETTGAAHRVLLGGASAGACLAAATALRVLDLESDLRLDGVVLGYGFFHAALPRNTDIQRRVRGRRRLTHAPRMLDAANRNYAGSRLALAERSAFPGGHDLRGFPATVMVDADRDAMRASGEQFAAELIAAGVEVERHVLPETHHAFLNRPLLPEFTIAIDQIASWALARRPVP